LSVRKRYFALRLGLENLDLGLDSELVGAEVSGNMFSVKRVFEQV